MGCSDELWIWLPLKYRLLNKRPTKKTGLFNHYFKRKEDLPIVTWVKIDNLDIGPRGMKNTWKKCLFFFFFTISHVFWDPYTEKWKLAIANSYEKT